MSAIKPEGTVFVPDPPGTPPPSRYGSALPTVFVVSDQTPEGYVEINETDFDPAKHQIFTGDVHIEWPSGRFVHP